MKVVLFKIGWTNPKQALIGLFTWSSYCHAGLLFKGEYKVYDASESRGTVDYNKHIRDWGKQKITVYEIPEEETKFKNYAIQMKGTKYDWKGIAGWFPFLASNDPKTVYCFELVLQTLLSGTKINGFSTKAIGGDLRQKLFKKPIDSDDIFILMERAQIRPCYEGIAAEYH